MIDIYLKGVTVEPLVAPIEDILFSLFRNTEIPDFVATLVRISAVLDRALLEIKSISGTNAGLLLPVL